MNHGSISDVGNDLEPGDIAFITKDIWIDGQLAFSDNEKVIIERIHANEQRPEYKYVVVSKRLLKRFQLRDEDLRIGNKEAINEPLDEMLKLQKKTYAAGKRVPAIIACAVGLLIGLILLGIPIFRYMQVNAAAGGSVGFGTFVEFYSWVIPCLIFGVMITGAGLFGLIAIGLWIGGADALSSKKPKGPCPHCGAMIIANAVFCRFCGKNISHGI